MAVVVASRSIEHHEAIRAAAEEFDGVVDSVALDVREPDRVEEVFRAAAERHGGLDVMVANAAGNFAVPSMRLKPKGWRAVIDIALSGAFYSCQSAGRIMKENGGGSIVTIGTTYSWTGMPGVVHSAAAKAGVLAMTRTLAVEWAPLNIRVNNVAPGPFHSDGAAANLWPDEEVKKRIERAIPLKRFAAVEEVADAVLYLASDGAAYVTGECLVIDGGAWLGKGLGG
jgi:NAD(P)-dependent dehydrogenase (short-subunit alcohol dehydrogenase family)